MARREAMLEQGDIKQERSEAQLASCRALGCGLRAVRASSLGLSLRLRSPSLSRLGHTNRRCIANIGNQWVERRKASTT